MLGYLFSGEKFLTLLVVIGIFILLIAAIKYEHARPVLIGILCVVWLGGGVYSGVTWYHYETTQNSVTGSPTIHKPYEDFDFYDYKLDQIVWYQNEDGSYYYEITYPTSVKFEGAEGKYQLLVNNSPCKKTSSTNGRLQGIYEKAFKDIDGKETDKITFEINFAFYSSKITLTINTTATTDSIGLVREYVDVNGFELRIISSVYN